MYDADEGFLANVTVVARTEEVGVGIARESCGIPEYVPLVADEVTP